MPDPTIATMAAREAVRRLLSLYCDAVARRDADAVGALLADDVRIRIAGGDERVGRQAAVEGLRRTIADFTFLHQKCDTGLIDVDGRHARARIGVMEINQRIGSETINAIFGVYEDEYRLTADGWRFARRDFTLQHLVEMPATAARPFQTFDPRFTFLP